MIQLMIVDDEPLFREYLYNFINWEDYGFTVVGQAKNGQEALELAEQLQPDVVLTDINMPKMNGLDFADALLKSAPETGVVFITGHNEFEYAKRAVKLGASDYILKPFEKEELILTLLKLKDNIHKANEPMADEAKEDTSIILPLLSASAPLTTSDIDNIYKRLNINYETHDFIITTMDIDHLDHTYSDQEEKFLWRFSVMNIFEELLEDKEDIKPDSYKVFYDYEGNMTCLFAVDKSLDQATSLPMISVFTNLTESVQKYLDFTITIGIGTRQSGLNAITKSYNEALSALSNKYLKHASQLIYFNDLPTKSKDFSFYNAAFNEALLNNLRTKNQESVTNQLSELYNNMQSRHISPDYSRIIQMGLISSLLSHITQTGKTIALIFDDHYSPYTAFETCDTITLQKDFMISLYKKVITYYTTNTQSRSEQIAESAKTYIKENYSNSELSVQMIANQQFINQTYLRSTFKKVFAITVSDYITKTRMEKGAELIIEKTYRLADIAEMVGYKDSSYFSKCFKKYHGSSPSQFQLSR